MRGDYLGQIYKEHLSDYETWEQKDHAREWILLAKNLGLHLSIDECMYCGELYTFVSNKDAHGGQGAIIAMKFNGLPEMPIDGISLQNITILAKKDAVFTNCKNITKKNVNIKIEK